MMESLHPVDGRILELEAFVYLFGRWYDRYPEWMPQDPELEALAISAKSLLSSVNGQ
jgi:hypothetical protein